MGLKTRYSLGAALSLLAILLAAPGHAGAAGASSCAKFAKKAQVHGDKARAYDRKALALRKKANHSKRARQKFDKFRRLTSKHARKQGRNNRRFERCHSANIRGAYSGRLDDAELPVAFDVSKNVKWVSGFRVEVELTCTKAGETTTRTAEVVLDERIAIGDAGRFERRAGFRDDPSATVIGRLRDGKATGSVYYSTGSQSDLDSEFCRSQRLSWTAERA